MTPDTDARQVDLDPREWRRKSGWATRRQLVIGFWAFFFGALLCAWTGWMFGAWWGALFPIPCAMMAGVALAGLDPAYWFSNDGE